MAETTIENKDNLKNFEQKIVNRSAAELLCLEKLADCLLECCSAEAKPNTLSLCSFLPLLLVSIFVHSEQRIWFILTAVAFFLHQILDIANKKQAYRLQIFSLGTYYVDHLYDSFSSILIVYIMGQLIKIPNNWLWFSIFAFSILPFYVHHLAMYYNQYMWFHTLSPSIQGLLFLQIFCIICAINPQIPSIQIVKDTITIGTILIILATVWLVVFLVMDLRKIYEASSKHNESFAFKNLFVVFVLGYIMFENTVIEEEILKNSNTVFNLFMYSLMFCFSLIIGELIMKYAENKKFQQISLNTLIFTAWIVLIYAICAFATLDTNMQINIAIGMGIALLVGQVIMFLVRNRQIMKEINDGLNS